jgi:hypothetical protein
MIKFISIPPRKSINKSYLKVKPFRDDFENFKNELTKLISQINENESEEHNKKFVSDFISGTFYSDKFVNTREKTDLAIFHDKSPKSKTAVIIETKRPADKSDMVSEDNLNRKAMYEVILYYLRERIENKNDEMKSIIITNAYEWFIFKAEQFERNFYKSSLKKDYEKWTTKQKVSSNNDFFYNLIKEFLDNADFGIEGVHLDLRNYQKTKNSEEKKLIPLFKIFSPAELLKETFANDSNTLNKQFYLELLYIIGLEEHKEGSKKTIRRKNEKERDNGSLLENTIRMLKSEDAINNLENPEHFGETKEEQLFNIALELNITWINRILFLKLLEAQLVNYHKGDSQYKFLDPEVIREYDDLNELFHEVLARKTNERSADIIERFKNIPYLNSPLFDISELERKTIRIANLKDRFNLDFYTRTVFSKEIRDKNKFHALEYLLRFLDAYDFASESGEEIQEERKTIINASVLGLIFEKINGYKEGSYYTPGFITMYMAGETLRRAVVQKFNETKGTDYKDYQELRKNIDTSSEGREEANKIINSIKICDPAVGSGHFLVSCLNELIAVKADLRVLNDMEGRQVKNYSFVIENDELVVTEEESDELFEYYINPGGKPVTLRQELQETLFHEKETIIENCLFGVDINPNSVNICRLRLWIELLKNSYYTKESNYKELETLPNIDINIKQGNSLVSRFDIRQDIFTPADKRVLEVYKINVLLYKNEHDKNKRRELKESIEKTKERFKGIAVDPLYKEREQLEKLTEQLFKLEADNPLFKHEDSAEKEAEVEKKRNDLSAKIDKLSKEIKEKSEEYRKIYSNAFEWRFEFPEALDEEGNFVGFDVVIGNPPYGRYLGLTDSYKKFLKEKNVYGNTGDVAEFFINRIVNQILKRHTQFSFIIPKGLSYVNSWSNIRLRLLNDFNIHSIIDTSKSFEEALYEMMIFHIEDDESRDEFINCGFIQEDLMEIFKLNRKYFSGYIFYLGFPFGYLKILEKVKKNSSPIKNYMNYWYGKGGLTPYVNKDRQGIQLLTGKEIARYSFNNDIDKWYLLKKYITKDDWEKINVEKVVVQDIVAHIMNPKPHIKITASIDTENRFCLNTVMCFSEKDQLRNEALLALLNSKFVSFYYYYFVFNQAIRTMHFMPGYADELPIPINIFKDQNIIIDIVHQILKQKKQNPKADTTELEKEIDQMVYKLYGLTEEEIKIVEGENV